MFFNTTFHENVLSVMPKNKFIVGIDAAINSWNGNPMGASPYVHEIPIWEAGAGGGGLVEGISWEVDIVTYPRLTTTTVGWAVVHIEDGPGTGVPATTYEFIRPPPTFNFLSAASYLQPEQHVIACGKLRFPGMTEITTNQEGLLRSQITDLTLYWSGVLDTVTGLPVPGGPGLLAFVGPGTLGAVPGGGFSSFTNPVDAVRFEQGVGNVANLNISNVVSKEYAFQRRTIQGSTKTRRRLHVGDRISFICQIKEDYHLQPNTDAMTGYVQGWSSN